MGWRRVASTLPESTTDSSREETKLKFECNIAIADQNLVGLTDRVNAHIQLITDAADKVGIERGRERENL